MIEPRATVEATLNLLPVFLKLEGRGALVVGAGAVALEKVESLLVAGARIAVVAPAICQGLRALAHAQRIQIVEREFQADDLDGRFLVIAATDRPEVNAAVYHAAGERGLLANSVDDPLNCDFFFGSVVRRGELAIAISTAGNSPALAQRLKREIDRQLPAELGPWLDAIGEQRREILATHPAGEPRKALLRQLANRELRQAVDCPQRQAASLRQERDAS